MTEDNRKENIRAELLRATEALAAATLLYENGYISDAISRLYYFVLYNVRALLLSKGLEPRSHDGALRLLGLHFVRDGLMDKRAAQVFSKLMKFREEADYNPSSACRQSGTSRVPASRWLPDQAWHKWSEDGCPL